MFARAEKSDDLTTAVLAQALRPQRSTFRVVGLGTLLLSVFVFAVALHNADVLSALFLFTTGCGHDGGVKGCPQADTLYPERHAELSDERWKVFGSFHEYLASHFLLRTTLYRFTL